MTTFDILKQALEQALSHVGGVALLVAVLQLLVAVFGSSKRRRLSEETYREKLGRLTGSLQKASGEVDDLLRELAQVATARETAVADLEMQLQELGGREQEMKKRVEDLKATPIPVADHFAALLLKGERRSAKRDYLLFGLGVLVSTIVAIVLRFLGLG